MDDISKAKIRENRDFLCENTSLLRDIIKHLNNYDMFNAKEEFDILNGSDDAEEQLGDFYDLILRKGKHAYGRLIEALQVTQNNTVLQRLEGTYTEIAGPSTQSKTNQPVMTEKTYQKILRKALLQCCNKTGNLVQLLNALHGEEVISKHEISVIRSKPTEFEQNSELFGFILPKRDPEIFPVLLECLRESENHFVENVLIKLQNEMG